MYTLLIVSLVVLSTDRVHVHVDGPEKVYGLTQKECYKWRDKIRAMGPTKQAQCVPEVK